MNETTHKNSAITILRWGLAFVFFYAAVASLLDSQEWIRYIPGWIQNLDGYNLLLTAFSVYQLILAVLLFSGRKVYLASILATATLVAITAFNFGTLDVVFRDIGLTMAGLALFELVRHKK